MSDKTETVEQDSTDSRDLEIEKLRAKNKELLSEKQKEKAKAQALADEKDEAETRAAESGGNMEALKAAHAKELAKLQAKLDASDNDLRTIRIDNEITSAYSQVGRPELAEQFIDWAKNRTKYENGVAVLFDKPVGEGVAEYLNSDKGANFRRASDNSGGGATGNSNTKTTDLAGKPFSLALYQERKATDPAGAAAWATETGNGYMNAL